MDDNNKLTSWIDRATNEAPRRVGALARKHEELSNLRLDIERNLNFAPDDTVISKHLKENNSLQHALGSLNEQFKARDEELRALLFNQDRVVRKLRKFIDEMQGKADEIFLKELEKANRKADAKTRGIRG